MFQALIMGHFAWLWLAGDHFKKREFKLFCAAFCNISIYHLVLSFTRSTSLVMTMITKTRMMKFTMMTRIYIFALVVTRVKVAARFQFVDGRKLSADKFFSQWNPTISTLYRGGWQKARVKRGGGGARCYYYQVLKATMSYLCIKESKLLNTLC